MGPQASDTLPQYTTQRRTTLPCHHVCTYTYVAVRTNKLLDVRFSQRWQYCVLVC
jgi:hypothetical protein